MSEYRAITITQGSGGFGGPLTVEPKEGKDVLLYITGGGAEPDILPKIVELTGCRPVNGFKTSVPEEEIFLVIIDCGGTLRCGIYPQREFQRSISTQLENLDQWQNISQKDIYVSGVKNDNIALADGSAAPISEAAPAKEEKDFKYSADKKVSETMGSSSKSSFIQKIGMGAGKVVATFNSAAKESTNTVLHTIIPFMGFVSLLIGIIQGSGFGNWFAKLLQPLCGNIIGLVILGFICSIPFLSCLLGPGAVIAQIVGTLIGVEIGKGNIEPSLALPALFAINTQCACDFVPVGLGLAEADPETVEVGVPAVLYSRFITGVPRVIVGYLASFGLYAAK